MLYFFSKQKEYLLQTIYYPEQESQFSTLHRHHFQRKRVRHVQVLYFYEHILIHIYRTVLKKYPSWYFQLICKLSFLFVKDTLTILINVFIELWRYYCSCWIIPGHIRHAPCPLDLKESIQDNRCVLPIQIIL